MLKNMGINHGCHCRGGRKSGIGGRGGTVWTLISIWSCEFLGTMVNTIGFDHMDLGGGVILGRLRMFDPENMEANGKSLTNFQVYF